MTGTILIDAGILLTAEYLWNLTLYNQQKTLCNVTLNKNDSNYNNNVINYLYAVGRTDELQVSKLYLYIIRNLI